MGNKYILVTGGSGFIGTNFILGWIENEGSSVINLDKLTYAGNVRNLEHLKGHPRYLFVNGDINDRVLVRKLLSDYEPCALVNFAAETHVDRSIYNPQDFIQTNINGTFQLLQESLQYWGNLADDKKGVFRFLHISTDEVYGSLGPNDAPSAETAPYAPNSPYAASKAASDHLVRAYHHTYGLPTLTSNCSNNYGPFQFPEKFIPLLIINALDKKPLPLYGDGLNVRDWLYVGDHCKALRIILKKARLGEVYNIGGGNEKTNIEVAHTVCSVLDQLQPNPEVPQYASFIAFIKDRPGHDRRYAIDARKVERELGWRPAESFENGVRKTVQWYLNNMDWVASVNSSEYQKWLDKNYSNRGLP
jgi:dTDP-glucose 4,6-dehydratase